MISFCPMFWPREKDTQKKTQFICKLTKYHFSLKEIMPTKKKHTKRALMLMKVIKVLYLNSSPQQGFLSVLFLLLKKHFSNCKY